MRVLIADASALIRERLQGMLTIYSQMEIVGLLKKISETLGVIRIFDSNLEIVGEKIHGTSNLKVSQEIPEKKQVPQIHHSYFIPIRLLLTNGNSRWRGLFLIESRRFLKSVGCSW